jgi:MYXO-CTERM domain-containing protein
MTLLFRVAIAVIALHVLDDSFVQPQPGTSAGDHLVSGLVPLTGLALAAWAFPRLKAGAQGALALILGPVGLVAGAEAVYYMRHGGLSGDDYTGLPAIVAGLALIGIGAAVLWRSRRRHDHLLWRYPRRALLVVASLFAFVWVVGPFVLGYGFTHIARTKQAVDLGVPHERMSVKTSDGLRLAGLYVPSRNGAAVLAFPGRVGPLDHAKMLVRHGYGVLLLDRRGEGFSEGDPNAFGWDFDKDIAAGVRYLQARPEVDDDKVGGLGLSVGGEMMLQTAAEDRGLAAVVSEGAGARMLSEEVSDVSGFEKVLNAPQAFVKFASVSLFSGSAPPADLETLLPKIAPRPVLLINAAHHEVDAKAPEYYAAARSPKQQWSVPRGGHTDGIDVMPDEYERRVAGFFDEAFGLRGEPVR